MRVEKVLVHCSIINILLSLVDNNKIMKKKDKCENDALTKQNCPVRTHYIYCYSLTVS